jgi:hypothetical protein
MNDIHRDVLVQFFFTAWKNATTNEGRRRLYQMLDQDIATRGGRFDLPWSPSSEL